MALAVELDPDPGVDLAVALHPLADTRLGEQVGGPLLEHARPDAAPRRTRGCGPRSRPMSMPSRCEQVGEHQAGRAGTDDPDLRSRHSPSSSSSTCWAIANAEFASGDARVHRALEEHLLDLVGGQAVAERGAHVHRHLVVAAQRDEHGQRDAASRPAGRGPGATRSRPRRSS